jgi:hypothetical protein
MNSIVRALNNIAISLGRIAEALNNKVVTKNYTSIPTTSTSIDNKVAITSYKVNKLANPYQDVWKQKKSQEQFQKHKHDYISQTIQELSSKDNKDILLVRLRNIVINNNISNPLVVNPKVHEKIMQKHRQEWPSLWLVIDELIKDSKKIKQQDDTSPF